MALRVPRRRANAKRRHRLKPEPRIRSRPTSGWSGRNTHANKPACRVPRAAWSTTPGMAGRCTTRRFANQLRVKLGIIRPPTTEISTMTAARPRRHPSPAVTATPAPSKCISRLAVPKTPNAPIIARLRQFRAARISRATSRASTVENERSTIAANHAGTSSETMHTTGPSNHKLARSAKGAPLIGGRPVQFGIAVSRNPAIVAITKPNSISWICQASGSKRLGRLPPIMKMTIHSSSAAGDHNPAARKSGRNPWLRKIGAVRLIPARSAMLIYFAAAPRQAGCAPPRVRRDTTWPSRRSRGGATSGSNEPPLWRSFFDANV